MRKMNEIRFTIPGKPCAKQRPRVVRREGGSVAYTPKETVQYENLVKMCYREKAKELSFPDGAMVGAEILAYYEIPKSTSKKTRVKMIEQEILPTKKPDADNIVKSVCDSLNTIAWHDDSAVVDLRVRKLYSETPRVEVRLWEIKANESNEGGNE